MEVKEALNKRRSIRTYTGESITEEQLHSILQAADEAPVGMGKYGDIHLTVVSDQDLLEKIDAAAAAFFQNPDAHPLYGAPLLIIISSASDGNVASANAGFIIENMSLAAVEQGIGQCAIYGAMAAVENDEPLKKELQIPEGYTILGGIILGQTNETYTDREIPDKHKFAVTYLK